MNRLTILLSFLFLTFTVVPLQADDTDVLAQKVRITTGKGTVYQLLKEVSEQVGYSFIYDSQLIENDKKVNIRKGEYALQDAIYAITGNKILTINVLGNHLLLRLGDDKKDISVIAPEERDSDITLRGKVYDADTREPIQYVSIGIIGFTTGTVTNQNGEFQLIIPDSIGPSSIKISHIGYESREVEFLLLDKQQIDYYLKPRTITLQEITVSITDPIQVLIDLNKQKEKNYARDPVYLTSFYREGIDYKRRNIDLTEAVLQVYKTGIDYNSNYDQVKLIKKRRVTDQQKNDTIFPRMRSGINSCLVLDIIKEMPDFIDPANNLSYSYTVKNVTTIDNRLVNVITFKQKPSLKEPLYTGDLYIEAASKALIEIQFEMNPRLVDKATNYFIDRKAHDLNLSLQEAKYIVSYKLAPNGINYINHIRGDIVFNVRKKNQLFSSPLHFWFEMVTCKIATEDVKSFPRNERLLPDRIFAETKHPYDQNFWENFNLILPEERLMETMINNLNEVIVNAE